jgi:RNA 2',3'-cyclic 3'-phosphodiesterase
MPRLFTGIEVPPSVAQGLAMLRGGIPGARWIDPENYHLTLRFIGDVDGAVARDVLQILGGVRRAPFEITLDRLDQFGGRKPRAIFAGASPNPALIELQAEHERLLKRMGLPPEPRKFSPHVTLARLRDASAHQVADYLSSRGPFRLPPFPVTRFVLFSSKASTGGGPYVVEAAYPLLSEMRMARHA